jgi:hypothetical protein
MKSWGVLPSDNTVWWVILWIVMTAFFVGVGIVKLAARGILGVSVARRLGSEGPLLAYCAAPL